MISTKAIVAYLVFALAATAFFGYLLFPDAALNTYVEQRLAVMAPGLQVTADSTRPTLLPPGVKMTAVGLSYDGQRLTQIATACIYPHLRSLLDANKKVRFTASLADGTLNGTAATSNDNPSGRLRFTVDLDQIRLERIDAFKKNERFTDGSLARHIANDVSPNPSSGGVNGRLSVAGLKIQLKEPFFSLNDLVMEKTDAEFTMSGGNIRLTALTFDGPMVEGRITGVIDIRQPMQDSRLNLSGNVKPRPDLIARLQESLPAVLENVRTLGTRGLNFRVRGTIDNPDLSMR